MFGRLYATHRSNRGSTIMLEKLRQRRRVCSSDCRAVFRAERADRFPQARKRARSRGDAESFGPGFCNRVNKFSWIERLGQKSVEAGVQCTNAILCTAVGDQPNHWHPCTLSMGHLAEPANKFIPIRFRQPEIANDNVRRQIRQQIQRIIQRTQQR